MGKIVKFFKEGISQYRWTYFSLKRMILFSIGAFLFFITWRLLFGYDDVNEILLPTFLLRKAIQALIMGFIVAFHRPISEQNELQ